MGGLLRLSSAFARLSGLCKLEVECGSSENSRCVFLLPFLCGAWFLLWFLLPAVLLQNTFIDILEIIVWSRNLQFGYDRNPYFGAWLSHFAYLLTGGSIWIFYLLSQLSVLISFICVWKLARSFLPPAHAFVSVALSMGLLFYGIKTLEFNDDVLEIGLWSLSILFLHKALVEERLRDWVFVGVFTGLSFMTKYYGLVLFASMALAVLLTAEGRAAFRRPGIYLGGLIFCAISLPNVIWLWQNNFVSIFYSFERANLASEISAPLARHFSEPWDCLMRTLPALLPSLIAFAVIFHRRSKSLPPASSFNKLFLAVICWGPFALTMLFSILTGGEIKYSWLTPDFILLGLFLVAFWRPFVSVPRLAFLLVFVAVLGIACASAFSVQSLISQPCKKRNCPYENFPGKAVAADMGKVWSESFGSKLKYVIGPREEACNVAVYSEDRPSPFFCANKSYSQWIDEADLRKSGALILWKGDLSNRPYWFESLKLQDGSFLTFESRSYPRAGGDILAPLFGLKAKDVMISFVLLKPAGG